MTVFNIIIYSNIVCMNTVNVSKTKHILITQRILVEHFFRRQTFACFFLIELISEHLYFRR